MSSTVTTTAGAYPVLPEQISWGWGDWLEAYPDDSYERSVIWAADPDTCRLTPRALARLLQEHGLTVHQLEGDAHPRLPLEHAGQALSWLGY